MKKSLFAAAIGCALLAAAATSAPPSKALNSKCPVSGKAVDSSVTSTIKKNVGFC